MDDQIVVYDTNGGFKKNKNKKFNGHLTQGYACGFTISPDGQFVCSGDGQGKLWFWSWKTSKNYRTINAHDGVCIDA